MTFEAVDHNHNHQGVETKNVLVGIRFDECGRELLDWAMVKVADAGDRVIAINVCHNSGNFFFFLFFIFLNMMWFLLKDLFFLIFKLL